MPTYGEYLKVDELLGLQRPLSEGPEHDEMLFIVIHQVYELWFKQVLHELDYLEWLLARNDGDRARHTLKRILTILKVMVAQLDILETMTPLEFLSFRDRLESGSGFQSHQFRELEFASASRIRARWSDIPPGARRAGSWSGGSQLGHAVGCVPPLSRRPTGAGAAGGSRARRHRSVEPSPELRPALVEVYRNQPALAELCERLVDLDEGLQEWRYRHVKMVQRTIGTRRGTGGSTGAEYLMTTLNKPLFPDLWAIRTELYDGPAVALRARPTRSRPTTPGSASPSGCSSPATRTRPGPIAASRRRRRRGSTPRGTWTTSGIARSSAPSGCARGSRACWATREAGSRSRRTPTSWSCASSRRCHSGPGPGWSRPTASSTPSGGSSTASRRRGWRWYACPRRRPSRSRSGWPRRWTIGPRWCWCRPSSSTPAASPAGSREVAAGCRRHGAQLLVDAYHALNVVPVLAGRRGPGRCVRGRRRVQVLPAG